MRTTTSPVFRFCILVSFIFLLFWLDKKVFVSGSGSVWAWGDDSNGQLGDGIGSGKQNSPENINFPNVNQIAASSSAYFTLTALGTENVATWGVNNFGQIGNGTGSGQQNSPFTIPGLSNVIQVAGGAYHSLALLANGSVAAWGENNQGQLGLGGTGPSQNSPVLIPGLSNVIYIAAGSYHSLAILGNGSVAAWGLNADGQLGNGNTNEQNSPGIIPELSNVIQVAGGAYHSLALLANGSVASCGQNIEGQLGNGNTNPQYSPGIIPGLSNVTYIAAGYQHSLAVFGNGSGTAWGLNNYGQIGNGTGSGQQNSPFTILGLSNVIQVAGGAYHSLALLANGSVASWGWNNFGQLGIGNTNDQYSPGIIPGLSNVTQIAAGYQHSLALVGTAQQTTQQQTTQQQTTQQQTTIQQTTEQQTTEQQTTEQQTTQQQTTQIGLQTTQQQSTQQNIQTTNSQNAISTKTSSNTVSLIAGILGGVVGICCILVLILLVFAFLRKQKKRGVQPEKDLVELDTRYAKFEEHTPYVLIGQALRDIIEFSDIEFDNPRKTIGHGAFGVVYKGKYNGEYVAVKEINGNAIDEKELKLFVQEADLMRTLPRHPNILIFIGISPKPFCIVTEYMEKGDLRKYLETNEMISDHRKLLWMIDICSGMEHLAKHHIVHRDLAARNCLLDTKLNVKISDFGLARIADTSNKVYSKSDVGPLKWMSVEAMKKKRYSEKSDVWSFGITCIEIITQNQPYPDLDAVQAASHVLSGLKPILPDKVDPNLKDILTTCWEENPDDRPTFSQLLVKLQGLQ